MHAGLPSRHCPQLLGRRKRTEALEQPLDEVDLRLGERRVEPDAPSRDPMPACDVEDVAARGAREVRVVEDEAPSA